MGRVHIWKINIHGKETTQGGDYVGKELHGKVITRGRNNMEEETTRGGDYTERGD